MATAPLDRHGNQYVVYTPVFDLGREKQALIFVPPKLLERVTDTALDVDGYDSETKTDALVSWVGRFATMELMDNGFRVSGWSSWGDKVLDAVDIGEHRQLPFLRASSPPRQFRPVAEDDELYEAEQRFSNRAMAFLLRKGILE